MFLVACIQAPSHWMDVAFRERWKFMLQRWRPDVYYWGSVVMTRNLLVAFAGIISMEPGVQLKYVICVVMLTFAATGAYSPWRAPMLNHYDVSSCIVLCFIGIFGLSFLALELEINLHERLGSTVMV